MYNMESGLETVNSRLLHVRFDDFEERTYKKVLSNYDIFIKTHLSKYFLTLWTVPTCHKANFVVNL